METESQQRIEEQILRVAEYARSMDLEREPIPGGAKFMVINGLFATGRSEDDKTAEALVKRTVETQLGTGELGFGDRFYYTTPCALTSGVLELYKQTGDSKYLEAAQDQIEYVLDAPRAENGGISHNKDGIELWVDSMYMLIPPIAQYGDVAGEDNLTELAADQLLIHADRLQDDSAGLFRHIWQEVPNDYPEGSFWGRGNGWAAAGMLEVIEQLPEESNQRKDLIELLNEHMAAVVDLQDECGYWYNVLDDDSTFLETSVTTIFAYVLQRGIDLEILPSQYQSNAKRAFRAIINAVNNEGVVTGATYVTTHDPNEQLTNDDVFSPSGYAQGWYLKTASYYLENDHY